MRSVPSSRAFTLIELLVVIAIVAVLAAVLFPVFAQAKPAAKKTAAISNAKQGGLAFLMYAGDANDRFPLARWGDTLDAENDTNPAYAVMPYLKSEEVLFDPMDPVSKRERENAQDLLPPKTEDQRRYNVAMTSDFGVNLQFIDPIWFPDGVTMVPTAIATTEVARPANTLFAVSSIWNRVGGTPEGGGNWVVDAPCWTDKDGKDIRPGYPEGACWWWMEGWNPSRPLEWNVFGGVWPWHNGGRQVVVEWADGHVKAVPMPVLSAGCDVKGYGAGYVTDPDKFVWASTR